MYTVTNAQFYVSEDLDWLSYIQIINMIKYDKNKW